MNTLPVERIERSLGPNLRVVEVKGDRMAPTLRSGADHLIVRPTHEYEGEALYALATPFGTIEIFRVQPAAPGMLALLSDNEIYSRRELTKADFDEEVVGIVLYQLHRLRSDITPTLMKCA
ncbi:MAG: S24 family peptidase [Hyphomicrobiales bacterium]